MAESESRLTEAERYLGLDRLLARQAELESEAADPTLWDDGDNARAVTTELGQVTADLEQLTGLRTDLSDAVVLLELINESRAEGAPDGALEKELVETVDALRTRLGALELQSLFSGEYDERDAVVDLHAGAGGTDAQDWTEMMLRMYQRWAERRGFTVELDEETEGQEAGPSLGHLHRAWALRLRVAGDRAGRAPTGAHVALRLPEATADQLRLA